MVSILESIAVDEAKGALNIVLATAVDEIKRTWGFRGDLDKLKERLTMLQAILVEAGTRKSLTNPEQLWVEKLNKVARHADDLFDEFSFENLRRKLEIKDRYYNRGSRLKARYLFFFCLSNPLGFRWRMAHQVKDVMSMIDGVFKDATDLGIRATKLTGIDGSLGSVADGELHQYRELVDTRQVVGRDGDEAYLVEQLCGAESTGDLSFVAIVGIPGIGKTTLARRIYENEAMIESFTERIWIYVSDDFNINRILSRMVEFLATSKPDLSTAEALIKKLQQHMGGARYLLVLDDVWNTAEELWESLKTCLYRIGGSSGSKVLLTSRSNAVADTVKVPVVHTLKGLEHVDSWALFKQTVFANGEACPSNLEESGRRIVDKCNGVPLAIKTLGGTLRLKRNLQDWKSIENSELCKLPEYGDRIIPYLLLSFQHLPSPTLKQCFAYCSIYEKGAAISKGNLIELWMAQGLLFLQEGSNLKMEEIGENYFSILLNHSFLQLPKQNEFGDIYTCKMHDLVHDLARFVCRRDWLIYETGGSPDESSSISHLVISSDMADQVSTPSMMKIMLNRLRTIQSYVHIPNDLLKQARYTRVLQLFGIGLTNVSDVIGELKYLRYLDLSANPFKELPESITTLYNLQTLKLIACDQLYKLPIGLSKLVNLRHLDINKFMKLEIGGLEHVNSKEEAQKAEIGAQPGISALHLKWSSLERDEDSCIVEELEVLDGLQPHPNLKWLMVNGFNGDLFPSWLTRMTVVDNIESGQLASLDNLVVVKLHDCRRCSHLPTLGQLPVLKTLVIDGMEAVRQIGKEFYTQSEGNGVQPDSSSSGMTSTGNRNALFPALTTLEIKNCPNLAEWLQPESTDPPVESFPCLEKLKIVGCPLLTITPTGFPSLRDLELEEIKSAQRLLQHGKWSNLTSLILEDVEELTHLPKEFGEQFTCLETLEINHGNNLACLPEDLGKLTSLKKLHVCWCPLLKSFPEIGGLRSLIQLCIIDCVELTETPAGLDACTSLESLAIYGCRNLDLKRRLEGERGSGSGEYRIAEWVLRLPRLREYVVGGNGINYENEPDHFVPDISPLLTMKSIRELGLRGWPKLKSLPDQLRRFTALEQLGIIEFDGLEEIPEWIGELSSLCQLTIVSCRNLRHLPSRTVMLGMKKLKFIWIGNCPILAEGCAKDVGPEWHKISHIEFIWVDDQTIQNLP
ncbi:hypothetical protein Dimus_006365 [Dionaea muscipula]